MTLPLPEGPLLSAFLLASLILAVTPGPGVLYIVTRTLAQGRQAGLASVAGVALGNLGGAVGAAIGLAALLAASSHAFIVIQWAGAAYLVYLGVKAFRAPAPTVSHAQARPCGDDAPWKIFRTGAIVALLNPKTVMFFAAFLPQFMDPALAPVPQSLMLGAVFVGVAAATDTAYVLAAGAVAPRLASLTHAARWGRRASGVTFIGLGLFAAASGSRGNA